MTISDLNTLARYLCDADTTSLTAAQLLIFVNKSYERITGKLITATGNGPWPFGDANYTAFPTYTMNLTNSNEFYQIDSLTTPLTVMAVEVLDKNGNYYPLKPISLREIRDAEFAASEFYETDGLPQFYELRENAIVLYPAPDNGVSVTLTSGLKVFFLRTADVFTSGQVTTGTKEPGFPSPWHYLIAYEAALLYCQNYKKDRVPYLQGELMEGEKNLMNFISMRAQDVRPTVTVRPPGQYK